MQANAQPVAIHFADRSVFTIQKVTLVNAHISAWHASDDQLSSMFYTYQYPSDIQAYKSIFYKGQYPVHIDDVFADWSQKMKQSDLFVEAVFYGTLDDKEIACIQFYFSQAGYNVQLSALAQRIEGTWYPLNTKENARYQTVMGLFGTLSPELVSSLIHPNTNSAYAAPASELLAQCAFGPRAITDACLEGVAETWGTGDAASQQKARLLFKNRMRSIDPAQDQVRADAIAQYVQSLALPDDVTRAAKYYFSKQEGLKAVSLMYKNGLEKPQAELVAELNNVMQASLYRHINYQIQEKPNAN
jgi:hypothetical protein